jgi:hypothetical protein
MTQTAPLAPLPLPVDLRTVRSDRCRGEGGWMVGSGDDPWWTACDGCCTCLPSVYVAPKLAPAATEALARAMGETAEADQPF